MGEFLFNVTAKIFSCNGQNDPASEFIKFFANAHPLIERVLEDGLTMRASFEPASAEEIPMTVFAWLSPEINPSIRLENGHDELILPDASPQSRQKALLALLDEEPELANRFDRSQWLTYGAFPLNNPIRDGAVIVNRRRCWRRRRNQLKSIADELVLPILKGFLPTETKAPDALQYIGQWLSARFGRGRGADRDAMAAVYHDIIAAETPPPLEIINQWKTALRTPGPRNYVKRVFLDPNLDQATLTQLWPTLRERTRQILQSPPPLKKGRDACAEQWMRSLDSGFSYYTRPCDNSQKEKSLHNWWLTILELGLRRLLTATQNQRLRLREFQSAYAELTDVADETWKPTLENFLAAYRAAEPPAEPPHPRVYRGWAAIREQWVAAGPETASAEDRRQIVHRLAEQMEPKNFGDRRFFDLLAEPRWRSLWEEEDVIGRRLPRYTKLHHLARRKAPVVAHFTPENPPFLEFGRGRMGAALANKTVTIHVPTEAMDEVTTIALPIASRELNQRKGRFDPSNPNGVTNCKLTVGGVKILPPKTLLRRDQSPENARISPVRPARLSVLCRAETNKTPMRWEVADGVRVAAVDLSQPYLAGVAVWEVYSTERLARQVGDAARHPLIQRIEHPLSAQNGDRDEKAAKKILARRIAPQGADQPEWAVLRRCVVIDHAPERRATQQEKEFLEKLDVPESRRRRLRKVIETRNAILAALSERFSLLRDAVHAWRARQQQKAVPQHRLLKLAESFRINADGVSPEELHRKIIAYLDPELPNLKRRFRRELDEFLNLVFPNPNGREKRKSGPRNTERAVGGFSLMRLVFLDDLLALLSGVRTVYGANAYRNVAAGIRAAIVRISTKRGEYIAARVRDILRAEQCRFLVVENFQQLLSYTQLSRESNRRLRLQSVRRIQSALTSMSLKEDVTIRSCSNRFVGLQSAVTGQWGQRGQIISASLLRILAERRPQYKDKRPPTEKPALWIAHTGKLFFEPSNGKLREVPATINMAAMLGLRALAPQSFHFIQPFRYGRLRRITRDNREFFTVVQNRTGEAEGDTEAPDQPTAPADPQVYFLVLPELPKNSPLPERLAGADPWTWPVEQETPNALPAKRLLETIETNCLEIFYNNSKTTKNPA